MAAASDGAHGPHAAASAAAAAGSAAAAEGFRAAAVGCAAAAVASGCGGHDRGRAAAAAAGSAKLPHGTHTSVDMTWQVGATTGACLMLLTLNTSTAHADADAALRARLGHWLHADWFSQGLQVRNPGPGISVCLTGRGKRTGRRALQRRRRRRALHRRRGWRPRAQNAARAAASCTGDTLRRVSDRIVSNVAGAI